jgi:hypothetical protein
MLFWTKSVEEKMSKILSKQISKTMVSKRMLKLCQKKHKNKSVKNSIYK